MYCVYICFLFGGTVVFWGSNIIIILLNLFNKIYISDAQNNDTYNANSSDFDAKSAGVFFGLGRRFNLSARFTF